MVLLEIVEYIVELDIKKKDNLQEGREGKQVLSIQRVQEVPYEQQTEEGD